MRLGEAKDENYYKDMHVKHLGQNLRGPTSPLSAEDWAHVDRHSYRSRFSDRDLQGL